MRARTLFAGAAVFGLTSLPVGAQTVAGDMTCSIAGGFGLVVASSRGVSCAYDRPDGSTDFYMGSSTHVGVDLGPADALTVTYRVGGPNASVRGALTGVFGGLTAGATLGSGIGADALVGGQGGSIVLAPTGNSKLTGLNVTAAIAALTLRYVGSQPRPRRVDPIYR